MNSLICTIKKRRGSRRMSIIVKHDGAVTVTIPRHMSEREAYAFVYKKSDWIKKAQDKIKKRLENKIALKQSKGEFAEKKTSALTFIESRLKHFNTIYNFSYKNVRVKNHSSRWGSCSAKGNLNFNYKLLDLPLELADYIVVHELCHLKELNHGKKFWDIVAQAIPDYKLRQQKLKKNYVTIQ